MPDEENRSLAFQVPRIRNMKKVRSLADLRGRRIYIGGDGSGTQPIARNLFGAVGLEITSGMRSGTEGASYHEAAERFQRGELDAVFYCSGRPTDAVKLSLRAEICRKVTR